MATITGLEAIEMLRVLGLSVRLDGTDVIVAPAELVDDDVAWLVRRHKAEIVAELLNDGPRWAWLLHFADAEPLVVYCHPEATRDEVLAQYPDAVSIEPLPQCLWPADTMKEQAA